MKLIRRILNILLVFIICYLFGVFMTLSFDITIWEQLEIFIIGITAIGIYCIVCFINDYLKL